CTCCHSSLSSNRRRPPLATLFPYTTLFRSGRSLAVGPRHVDPAESRLRPSQGVAGRLDAFEPQTHRGFGEAGEDPRRAQIHGGSDRKSTRLNSSHVKISYAVFCLKNTIQWH